MPDGTAVDRYTLTSRRGSSSPLITYGACVQQLWAPDRDGRAANVVLGFADPRRLRRPDARPPTSARPSAATRTGSRTATFTLDGVTYRLPVNDGAELAARRATGFDRRVWDGAVDAARARQRRRSSSATRARTARWAIPGTLEVEVTYTLSSDNGCGSTTARRRTRRRSST